ncbi:MAG: GGDEF domain-containing protein [Pseudorhodobacter sp.]|nr:GGDEF domain-containing protein [Rhizobacter sp.]
MTTALPAAQIAKATLRRLALERLEPTPENYLVVYRQEQGDSAVVAAPSASAVSASPSPAVTGEQLAQLVERLVRGLDRGSVQWTLARRKGSLKRVLESSRSDAVRMHQRMSGLINGWDNDGTDASLGIDATEATEAEGATEAAAATEASQLHLPDADAPAIHASPTDSAAALSSVAAAQAAEDFPDAHATESTVATVHTAQWRRVVSGLDTSLQQALPVADLAARDVAHSLKQALQALQAEGINEIRIQEIEQLCERAGWVIQHRHNLTEQLGVLCHELTDSLTDLAEDDSWAQGQSVIMRARLGEGLTARSVKSVSELLRVTRERQAGLRTQRDTARESLKSMIQGMLTDLGELGRQTGRFQDNVGRYADIVEDADSLESLAGVVREMVAESRAVHEVVSRTRERLNDEHQRAGALAEKVSALESELKRLSSEVSTDPLTQIANRRGLMQAFEAERSRTERADEGGDDAGLCVGLLDIDNFKMLNDKLGHGAGDEALKALAQLVSTTLRPTDVVARYGGEEFVVLLPETAVEEGQQILTRLQRSLTGGLFMHEDKKVLVTFSAGVTAYRDSERIEDALERADQALYVAKRTGKNRTCVG